MPAPVQDHAVVVDCHDRVVLADGNQQGKLGLAAPEVELSECVAGVRIGAWVGVDQ